MSLSWNSCMSLASDFLRKVVECGWHHFQILKASRCLMQAASASECTADSRIITYCKDLPAAAKVALHASPAQPFAGMHGCMRDRRRACDRHLSTIQPMVAGDLATSLLCF